MGISETQQLKVALIRQGVSENKIRNLSETELCKMCNEKLSESLTGNKNWRKIDNFTRNFQYNIIYTQADGQKIKVSKVATTTLPSGRKVETYIDIAGNQYFQYRAADNKILKENYFRAKEKIQTFEKIKYLNGKLYKTDCFGNLTQFNPQTKPTNFSNKNTTFSYSTGTRKIKYYSGNQDIMLTSDGRVDLSQFSIDYILAAYENEAYSIKQNEKALNGFDKTISIRKNKDNGKLVCTISSNKTTTHIVYPEDKKSFTVKNGVVTEVVTTPSSGKLISEYKGKIFKNKYADKNNKIILIETGIIGNADNSKIESPFLYKLHEQLHAKNWIGYEKIDKTVFGLIKQNINKENYDALNYAYKKLYGTTIANDIITGNGLKKYGRLNLLNQIGWKNEGYTYLAKTIKDDLDIVGGANLEYDIKKYINKDNIIPFLKEFCESPKLFGIDLAKYFSTNNNNVYERTNLLLDITQNIIKAISDKKTITNKTKNACIEHITNNILNCQYIGNDLKNDIIKNKKDIKHLTIDVNRVINRNYKKDTFADKEELLASLKTSSFRFTQSYNGDCWLLSVMLSAYYHDNNSLNSLIKIDKNNKTVTITLKGVNKKYTFTYETLLDANHFDKNDLKVRAFEMAIDTYYKENAYKYFCQETGLLGYFKEGFSERLKNKYFDTQGNSPSNAIRTLFGVESYNFYVNNNSPVFDFKKNCYIFIMNGNVDDIFICKTEFGEDIELYGSHDYDLIKTDDEYLYLINPWDSTKIIKVTWDSIKDISHSFTKFSLN